MIGLHLSLAARTLWQEARGEPIEGRRAVAHVIINRRNSGRWGDTFGEVCLSEFHGVYQFSGWARSDPNRVAALRLPDADPLLVSLAELIFAAESEPDPTGGATHYYAPRAISPPSWVAGAIPCGTFGNQSFFKNVK